MECIFLLSCDTHFVHKAWHDASDRIKKIQYPLLADPTHALAKDFEVLIEADGLAERGTFIVNPEGKIVAYEVNAGNVGRNAAEHPDVTAEVYDLNHFPDMKDAYQVMSVPCMVINGGKPSFGKKNIRQVLDLIV